MSDINTLPPAFWTRLAQHIENDTLKALSLTNRDIGEQAQRELFHELHFTGWRFDVQITKRQKPAVKAVLARIVGLRTSRVVPWVRRVVLKDWTQGHPVGDIWEIGEKLYTLLHALPNLQIVTALDMRLKSEHLMLLVGGSSRQIKSLTLRRCTFPFDASVPYHIPHLVLEEPVNLVGTAVDSMAYAATAIIQPEHTISLDISAPTILPQLLPQLVALEKDFSELRSLRIVLPAEPETWRDVWVKFLGRCDTLLALEIVEPADGDDAGLSLLARDAVRQLEAFSGSASAAVALLPGRQVRSLTIRLVGDSTTELSVEGSLAKLAQLDEQLRSRIREFRLETSVGSSIQDPPDHIRKLFPQLITFMS